MTKGARPLPVEYLLVELTTGSSTNSQPLLLAGQPLFPVESRAVQVRVGHTLCDQESNVLILQDFHALSAYLAAHQSKSSNFLSFMADFHLLLFLYTSDVAGIHMKVSLWTGSSETHCHPINTAPHPRAL